MPATAIKYDTFMQFRLRTPTIVLAIEPPALAIAYLAPRLTLAFLTLLVSAAFADWLARRMSAQPQSKPPDFPGRSNQDTTDP
jgi:hypothetical protein